MQRTLYAGVFDEGVFKSTDDGKTWALKKKGSATPKYARYRVSLHQDGTLFAIICARRAGPGNKPLLPEGVGLYRSRNGAETWEQINAPSAGFIPKTSRCTRVIANAFWWAPAMPTGSRPADFI